MAGTGGTGGDVAPATPEQKEATCRCWFDVRELTLPRLVPACLELVTDECVACTEEITGGGSCVGREESSLVTCLDECLRLVPVPTTAEECKELTAAGTDVPAAVESGNCMCDNCFDLYAPCITNSACVRVMLCVAEQGCIGLACTTDPVCMPIIAEAIVADESLLEPLSQDIANCSAEYVCQDDPWAPVGDGGPIVIDSGTPVGDGGTAVVDTGVPAADAAQ